MALSFKMLIEARIVRTVLVLTMSLAGLGCTGAPVPRPASHAAEEFRGVDLARQLRDGGLAVKAVDEIRQPFFTPTAVVYGVDGGDLQVFEFSDAASAEKAAARVAPGGSSVGTSMVNWMAPPHFFRKGRVVAIYIGSDRRVLDRLAEILGDPFAGG